MNDYFDRLFRFNNWANRTIGDCMIDNGIDDHDCIRLMSHLQLAQSNWYKRIVGQQEDQPVWQILELPRLLSELDSNGQLWLEYIQKLHSGSFVEWRNYNNLAGQPLGNNVQDLLAHVVNHATYHRGQIARRIRELGFTPPTTDYVLFAKIFPTERAS
ncbi:MAG: DinB family protein [Dyadobacter sp.]|uniref:DinB family protein n=1 Tax=Dyadobacter sp. TaxID=1914288 RepID=UPI0032633BE0